MDLAGDVGVPHFEALIHTFIQDQLHMPLTEPLDFDPNVNIYTSAVAVYHTPSDICGIHGMAKERIHATPKWGKFKVPRYDTAFAVTDPNIPGCLAKIGPGGSKERKAGCRGIQTKRVEA